MASSFTLRFPGGQPFTVGRKFLLDKRSINFVEIVSLEQQEAEFVHSRALPDSPFSLAHFPSHEKNFLLASEVCDARQLKVKINLHPDIETIGALRDYANTVSREPKQSKRYDECSQVLLGKYHAPLVDGLKSLVIQRFRDAFEEIQMVHPDDVPSERYFHFGSELHASSELKGRMYAIASEGHAYAQYIAGLLSASGGQVTEFAARMLVSAHTQGVPVALAALGERFLCDKFYLDALSCALLSMESGYSHASSILDNLAKATFNLVLETPSGYVPFLQFLVQHELDAEIRALAFKHRPQWAPTSPDQAMRNFMTRAGFNGGANV